eukprot:7036_1
MMKHYFCLGTLIDSLRTVDRNNHIQSSQRSRLWVVIQKLSPCTEIGLNSVNKEYNGYIDRTTTIPFLSESKLINYIHRLCKTQKSNHIMIESVASVVAPASYCRDEQEYQHTLTNKIEERMIKTSNDKKKNNISKYKINKLLFVQNKVLKF